MKIKKVLNKLFTSDNSNGAAREDKKQHKSISPDEIMELCRFLPINETRSLKSDYKEFVVTVHEKDKWEFAFCRCLGHAVCAEGKGPEKDDAKLTEPFGGIRRDQTLYKATGQDFVTIVMLWPWMDNEHITIKIAKVNNYN